MFAGGQSGLELAADRDDLSIRDADRATGFFTVGDDYCVVAGSNLVERFDAPTEILVEQPVYGRRQGRPAIPRRQSRYPYSSSAAVTAVVRTWRFVKWAW